MIIGLRGLRDLGLSADFKTCEIRMGSRIINTVGEIGREPMEKRDIEVNINKNLSEKEQEQLREISDRWKGTLVEKMEDRGQQWDTNLPLTQKTQSPFMYH